MKEKQNQLQKKGETLYIDGDKWGNGLIADFKVLEFEVYKVNY